MPMCEYCRTDGNRGAKCTCIAPQPDLGYPTAAAQEYKANFILGASAGGLRAIPDDVLNWAIDRAIAAKVAPKTAGMTLAEVYVKIQMRREFRDKHSRYGVWNPTTYLLKAFENELGKILP